MDLPEWAIIAVGGMDVEIYSVLESVESNQCCGRFQGYNNDSTLETCLI